MQSRRTPVLIKQPRSHSSRRGSREHTAARHPTAHERRAPRISGSAARVCQRGQVRALPACHSAANPGARHPAISRQHPIVGRQQDHTTAGRTSTGRQAGSTRREHEPTRHTRKGVDWQQSRFRIPAGGHAARFPARSRAFPPFSPLFDLTPPAPRGILAAVGSHEYSRRYSRREQGIRHRAPFL